MITTQKNQERRLYRDEPGGEYSSSRADDNRIFKIPEMGTDTQTYPRLDPQLRQTTAGRAKWMFLIGVLLLLVVFKSLAWTFWEPQYQVVQEVVAKKNPPKIYRQPLPNGGTLPIAAYDWRTHVIRYDLIYANEDRLKIYNLQLKPGEIPPAKWWYDLIPGILYAALVAALLPRLLFPGKFGRYRDAAEMMRDCLLIGLTVNCLVPPAVLGLRYFFPLLKVEATTLEEFLVLRLPLIAVLSFLGALLAQGIERWRSAPARRENLPGWVKALVYAALTTAFARHSTVGVDLLARIPFVWLGGGCLALLLIGYALVRLLNARSEDHHLRKVQGAPDDNRFTRGTVTAKHPVQLNITIIGSHKSGKTALLAGFYQQWMTSNLGRLNIRPVVSEEGPSENNLAYFAHWLYAKRKFPPNTLGSRNFKFDLMLEYLADDTNEDQRQEHVFARINLIDYPGQVLHGDPGHGRAREEFWQRVDNSDAVLLIADMGAARLRRQDDDYYDVMGTYREVLRRVVRHNGKNRVVPVGLVLTKCDEYVTPDQPGIDTKWLLEALEDMNYLDVITEWEERCMNPDTGPGVFCIRDFITSAVTATEPEHDATGQPLMDRRFILKPEPVRLAPTNCLNPVLWAVAEAMHWNCTTYSDLLTFLLGHDPKVHLHLEAIQELREISRTQLEEDDPESETPDDKEASR